MRDHVTNGLSLESWKSTPAKMDVSERSEGEEEVGKSSRETEEFPNEEPTTQ